jgi:hypothetical protein
VQPPMHGKSEEQPTLPASNHTDRGPVLDYAIERARQNWLHRAKAWLHENTGAAIFAGLLLAAGLVLGYLVAGFLIEEIAGPIPPTVWVERMTLRAGPYVPPDKHPLAPPGLLSLAEKHRKQVLDASWITSTIDRLPNRWPDIREVPDAAKASSLLSVGPVKPDASFTVAVLGSNDKECDALFMAFCDGYLNSEFVDRNLNWIKWDQPTVEEPLVWPRTAALHAGGALGLLGMIFFVRALPFKSDTHRGNEKVTS